MDQTPHRIQQDYKPRPSLKRRLTRLEWFIIGLGVPFLGLLIALGTRDAGGESPTNELPFVLKDHPLALPEIADASAALESSDSEEELVEGESVTLVVKRGDTLDRLFRAHGLDRGDLARIMRVSDAKGSLARLYPGDRVAIIHDGGSIQRITRELSQTQTLEVTRTENGFTANMIEHELERRIAHAHGRIESSLFEAAASAGVSDKIIMNVAGIYAWDIDFVLDIRKGDEFLVLYEQLWQDGEFQGDGEIIAAEFVNQGRTYRAVRFQPSGQRNADYFTPDGLSVRKAFLRAPVDFSRISSNFNLRRRHPIFKTVRPHRGVDYAAPPGTAIKAAGDGKVIFRGRKGGYGNAVILQHGGNITTLYGHMSRFARGSQQGKRVKQGQIIGYVGQTGYATGPHLHYEYRLNGVHRNPRTVKLPQAKPVPPGYQDEFLTTAGPLLAQLDLLRRAQVAIAAAP